MSRIYNGSAGSDEYITVDNGTLLDGGPITILSYWRPSSGEENQFGGLLTGRASGSTQWSVLCDTGDYFHASDFTGFSGVTADTWQIIGYSKAAGSSAVRWHHWDGSWTHANGSSSGDGSNIDSVLIGIFEPGAGRLDGLWVCSAVWNSELSDGQVEAAASATALQDWFDASPDALWAGNQASTSDPVTDLTGNGADETATLNPGVGGADPPGWSYTISSGVTGTLAETEEDDTLSASGTVTPPSFTGTLAETEEDDALAASGTVTPPAFTGTLAETEEDDTLTASGTVTPPAFAGTLAVTEQDDTLAASGTVTPPAFTGTLAVTEQDDTLAASGTVAAPSFTGTLAVTEEDDTLAASGTVTGVGIAGSLAVTEQDDALAASGVVSITGTLSVTEQNDTLVAVGTVSGGGQVLYELTGTASVEGLSGSVTTLSLFGSATIGQLTGTAST